MFPENLTKPPNLGPPPAQGDFRIELQKNEVKSLKPLSRAQNLTLFVPKADARPPTVSSLNRATGKAMRIHVFPPERFG
jgi:hypothetical protein